MKQLFLRILRTMLENLFPLINYFFFIKPKVCGEHLQVPNISKFNFWMKKKPYLTFHFMLLILFFSISIVFLLSYTLKLGKRQVREWDRREVSEISRYMWITLDTCIWGIRYEERQKRQIRVNLLVYDICIYQLHKLLIDIHPWCIYMWTHQ